MGLIISGKTLFKTGSEERFQSVSSTSKWEKKAQLIARKATAALKAHEMGCRNSSRTSTACGGEKSASCIISGVSKAVKPHRKERFFGENLRDGLSTLKVFFRK